MIKIRSFAESEEILLSSNFVFDRFDEEALPFAADTLITLNGIEHRKRRRLEAPLFSRSALTPFKRELVEAAIHRSICEILEERDADGIARANGALLIRQAFCQVIAALIGLDDVDAVESAGLLQSLADLLNEATVVDLSTRNHREVMLEGLEAKQQFIDSFVTRSIARRKRMVQGFRSGSLTSADLPKDLITLMLFDGWEEDNDLIVRESIMYLSAGVQTIAQITIAALERMEDWIEKHPGDEARLSDPRFLQQVANETLRLSPTFPAILRRSLEDAVLTSGRRVRAGELVALEFEHFNQDSSVFGPDASEFNPHRAVPDGIRPYGLAFGSGPKTCIGRSLVTPVSGSPHEDLPGSLVTVLRLLYQYGVRIDRDRPRKQADSAEVRYYEYPIRFESV